MPRSGPGPITGSWSISTVPEVGRSSPATMLSKVDLPQPDEPTRHTNSWSATSRFTWSMARTVPRFLVRYSFTRSVTTSFGGRDELPNATSGAAVSGPVSTADASAGPRTVTTEPTATPGCATSGGRGRS